MTWTVPAAAQTPAAPAQTPPAAAAPRLQPPVVSPEGHGDRRVTFRI